MHFSDRGGRTLDYKASRSYGPVEVQVYLFPWYAVWKQGARSYDDPSTLERCRRSALGRFLTQTTRDWMEGKFDQYAEDPTAAELYRLDLASKMPWSPWTDVFVEPPLRTASAAGAAPAAEPQATQDGQTESSGPAEEVEPTENLPATATGLLEELTMQPLMYQGKPCITLAMADKMHGRPEGTAKRNFQSNRDRFQDGVDCFVLRTQYEIRTAVGNRYNGEQLPTVLVLLTEPGYCKLCKSLNDDRAWAVQQILIDRYFQRKERGELEAVSKALATVQGKLDAMATGLGLSQSAIQAGRNEIAFLRQENCLLRGEVREGREENKKRYGDLIDRMEKYGVVADATAEWCQKVAMDEFAKLKKDAHDAATGETPFAHALMGMVQELQRRVLSPVNLHVDNTSSSDNASRSTSNSRANTISPMTGLPKRTSTRRRPWRQRPDFGPSPASAAAA